MNESTNESVFIRDRATWTGYLLVGHYCFLFAAFGPIMPFLRVEQGLNYGQSALHFSASAAGVLLAGATGHWVMKKLGCARAIWTCGLGVLISALIFMLLKNPVFTIFGAFIAGLGGSCMGQSVTTLMSERFGEKRALFITELNIVGSIFAMLGPFVVGRFLAWGMGWRLALLVPVAMYLVLLLSSRKLYTQFKMTEKGSEGGNLPLQYWFFWVVIWFSVASEWSMIFWTSEFLEKAKGLDKVDAAQAAGVFLISMLLGRMAGVRLVRTFAVGKILFTTAIISLIGFVTFWLGPNWVVSLVGLFITGLGVSNIYPMSFARAISFSGGKVSLGTARMSVGTGSAIMVAPLVLGNVGDRHGIFYAYAVVALLMVLVLVMVTIAAVKFRTQEEPKPTEPVPV